jgi:ABC-type nitrate/sulfonate/bicarbonate transport system substrate-binding protein
MNLNRLAPALLSLLLLNCALPPFAAGQKINTSYISTAPGSSLTIWVAKDAKIFDKYGIDATVIFISGSIRGIQSILAGEIPIGEGGGPGLASAGSPRRRRRHRGERQRAGFTIWSRTRVLSGPRISEAKSAAITSLAPRRNSRSKWA